MSFKKTLPRYDGMLELHARRVKIADPIPDAEFNRRVMAACNTFVAQTGQEIYLLGRSGRHVCIKDNPHNSKNYNHYASKALRLLKAVEQGTI